MRFQTETDGVVARAALAGDGSAYAELVERHVAGVWKAVYLVTGQRTLADDATQDAFATAFERLATFDQSRAFRPWVARIAINAGLNALRRDRRLVPLDPSAESPGESPAWVDNPCNDEALRRALARLTPGHRAAVALRYWLDLTPTEIAEALALPVGTVNSRLARALKALRDDEEVTR